VKLPRRPRREQRLSDEAVAEAAVVAHDDREAARARVTDPALSATSQPPTPETHPLDELPTRESSLKDLHDATDIEGAERSTAPAIQDVGNEGHQESAQHPESGLPRFVLILVAVAAIGLSLTLFKNLAAFLAPAFLALNLMITAYPLHRFLNRHKVTGWLSAIVAGMSVMVVLVAFVLGLAYSIAAMVGELPRYTGELNMLYRQSLSLLSRLGFSESVILDQLKSVNPQSVLSFLGGLLSGTQSTLSLLLVLVVTLIFMIMDVTSMDERMDAAAQSHPQLVSGLEAFAQGIRRYWLVTTVFGLIVATLDGVVLVGLGIPLALVWALFSFLTNYIPNVGFVIGLVPPALLALFAQGWVSALIVVGAYSVMNFVVQSIIQPKFAGDAVGLTPTLSFISLLLWAWVFGPLGALIALPCSLLVKALLVDCDPRARWVNALISSRSHAG